MKEHRQFTRFYDSWLAAYRETGRKLFCKEGCSGCCHLAVHATFPEAVAVAPQLSAGQAAELSDYVERIKRAQKSWPSLKSYLREHRKGLGPCPFLNAAGACSIYALRPLACRALLSTRPAAWCTVDFSELESWDKQAYESSLDRQVVAWPTHYIAATQDFARELEKALLESALNKTAWALTGNFAVMVWLEKNCQLSKVESYDECQEILKTNHLDNNLLLDFTLNHQDRV